MEADDSIIFLSGDMGRCWHHVKSVLKPPYHPPIISWKKKKRNVFGILHKLFWKGKGLSLKYAVGDFSSWKVLYLGFSQILSSCAYHKTGWRKKQGLNCLKTEILSLTYTLEAFGNLKKHWCVITVFLGVVWLWRGSKILPVTLQFSPALKFRSKRNEQQYYLVFCFWQSAFRIPMNLTS